MSQTTLLDYLALPNPELDCSESSTGTNTFNARWDAITRLQDWSDFNYETLMQLYEHILVQQVPSMPPVSPLLTKLAGKIITMYALKP